MLLALDVVPDAIPEHDDWHTHEHLPERLSIPGFLRGSRWTAMRGAPRYLVLYEVAELATLTSAAYLERLNNPTAWTTRLMPHYRAMRRGFCSVRGSFGFGIGHTAFLVRFTPDPNAAAALRDWLVQDALPPLPSRRGVGSVHLLEGAVAPPMTNEQRIRGADAGVDWALLLTGYGSEAVADVAQDAFGRRQLEQRGATDVVDGLYRIDYLLTRGELGRQAPGRGGAGPCATETQEKR